MDMLRLITIVRTRLLGGASHEEGVERAVEGVKKAESLRISRYQPLRLTLLANTYLLAGHQEEAHATAHQALDLARRYQERGPEAWALYLIAASRAASERTEAEQIKHVYVAALSGAKELGMGPLTAHCHLGLGQLHVTLGDAIKAREHLGQALALYQEICMQHWPEQAESALRAL